MHRTAQRDAIRRVMEESGRPLGPQEIFHAAREIVPGLGLTTVYRTLKTLLETGWLVTVPVPGEPNRYEVAGKPPHHHFHCRACGGLFDVTGSLDTVADLVPPGFVLEEHELMLAGLCATCHTAKRAPGRKDAEDDDAELEAG